MTIKRKIFFESEKFAEINPLSPVLEAQMMCPWVFCLFEGSPELLCVDRNGSTGGGKMWQNGIKSGAHQHHWNSKPGFGGSVTLNVEGVQRGGDNLFF